MERSLSKLARETGFLFERVARPDCARAEPIGAENALDTGCGPCYSTSIIG